MEIKVIEHINLTQELVDQKKILYFRILRSSRNIPNGSTCSLDRRL